MRIASKHSAERDRKFPKERFEKGVRLSSVCTKSIRKPEVNMFCYRGIKYNPADLKKQAKAKPNKDEFNVYRGVKQTKAA